MSNIITTVIIIAFIVSCDSSSERSPQSPGEMRIAWNSWLKRQERIGLKVLSVTESEQWLKENSFKISMPDNLSFMELHYVKEYPFSLRVTMITVDHNGKYRVVAKNFNYPPQVLIVGDKFYDTSDFDINQQDKVKEQYTYKNGVETHTVVFQPGGIVSGTDRQGTTSTYSSDNGSTVHLDADRKITKIEGTAYVYRTPRPQ